MKYYTKRASKKIRNLSIGDEVSYLGFTGKVVHVFDGREYSTPHFEYTIITDENPSRLGFLRSFEDRTRLPRLQIRDTSSIKQMTIENLTVCGKSSKLASLNDVIISYEDDECDEFVPVEPGMFIKDSIHSYEVLYVTPEGSLVVKSDAAGETFIPITWDGYSRFINLYRDR